MYFKFFIISLILCCFVSCTKVYHNRYVFELSDKTGIGGYNATQDGIFKFGVTLNSIGASDKYRKYDSVYYFKISCHPNTSSDFLNIDIANSFELTKCEILFVELSETFEFEYIEEKQIRFDDYCHNLYEFDNIKIPAEVKNIGLTLVFSYLNEESAVVCDTFVSKMIKSVGHYTVPLGPLLD